jgi:tetratricopeptide (TPR) repeat protein
MRANISPRTIRNIVAADGYIDLNMPEHALAELESIDDAGFYEAPRQFLMGRALKMMDRLDEAIRPLEEAARRMPSPYRKLAWAELTECYRHLGSEELAQIAESLAGSAEPEASFKLVLPEVELTLESREQQLNRI